ncbi:hypothetical protein ABPG75_003056 [Micractinium tetrahymenae]
MPMSSLGMVQGVASTSFRSSADAPPRTTSGSSSSSSSGLASISHPAGFQLPSWVDHGWVVDSMAERCEGVQDWPFLRTQVPPRVGQRLYMNVIYDDGSGSGPDSGRARMVGHVTEVLPPPPPGVYGF